MNSDWQNFLVSRGAALLDDGVLDFGDAPAELSTAKESAVLCDLSHLGIIRVAGEDSLRFLQGQLSNDIHLLTSARAQLSSYNTPKGRMLANFLIWQQQDIFLQVHASLLETTLKRLSMYVLRAKVKLTKASDDYVAIGVGGPAAARVLEVAGLPVPDEVFSVNQEGPLIIRLPGNNFTLICSAESAPGLWEKLAPHARAAGRDVWEWLQIRAGLPMLTTATQDLFVPQMLNYDLIGGVNFKKGCYPGQEIVARTQYLGKLKRRMYLCHLEDPHVPAPADALYSADLPGQATGTVVNSAQAPDGGSDFLAVIQMESAASQTLHWQSLEGPAIQRLDLPYPV